MKPVLNSTAKYAFDLIRENVRQNSQLIFTYEIGKFVSADTAQLVKQYVQNAAMVYSRFVESDRPVTIHVYTEKDLPELEEKSIFSNRQDLRFFANSWAKDSSIVNNAFGYPGSYLKDDCWVSKPIACKGRAGHAGVGYPSASTGKSLDLFNLTVAPHELFHVIQDFYRYKGDPAYFVSEEVKDFSMAPVFREGGATFMQMSATVDSFEDYEAILKVAKVWMLGEYGNEIKGLQTSEDVVALLTKLEKLDRSSRIYSIGAKFHEWLLATYGFEKFVSLTKSHSVEKSFAQVFSSVYGITLREAYLGGAPHILERLKG
jgi:hypothetical protein